MHELARTLTVSRGVGVGVTTVVGSGLLVLPGLAYGLLGPAAIFAWLGAAVVVAPLLVIFARLGGRHPNAGGVVGFAAAAFGPAGVAPTVFLLLGACAFGGAAIAVTAGRYFAALPGAGALALPAAACCVVVVALLNVLGSRTLARVQSALTGVLLVLVSAVVVAAVLAPNWTPAGRVGVPAHWTDVLPAVGLVFFAFTGWELLAATTEEYRNPHRDVPRALAITYMVVVALYAAVALAVQTSLPAGDPRLRGAPLAAVLARVFGGGLGDAVGVVMSVVGGVVVLATLVSGTWAASRIGFDAARHGLLPARLRVLHPRTRTPVAAVLLLCGTFGIALVAHAAGLVSLETMFRLSAVNFVSGYAVSVLAHARLFPGRGARVLSVAALVPVAVVLAGFGWLLLYPAALLVAGTVVHRVRCRRELSRGGPSRAGRRG
ncbi:APC family permease [Labedaea rhizosphaerae]|uniref:Amino acid efflux transporter n=1 Tax=Labedaea rhizosphaerae TaxID=598644 RepID=A0A4V3CY56_LABRH|nr:APC family permease [Labedaea rhizosphaerae]TDP92858.1 amino acid efflux transporter [Labedaea rhizosphaerae]